MRKYIKHLELFAGIGGFREAFDLFAKDNNLISKCIGFSENDRYALISYNANFDNSQTKNMNDISLFNKNINNIKNLNNFDFLTAGFPCQPFSSLGRKKGLDDERGNVFYEISKILKYKKPKYFLLENVRNLQSHDKGKTFEIISETLTNKCGYEIYFDIFNTANYGLPQNRRRIFIYGIRKNLNTKNIEFSEEKVRKCYKNKNIEYSIKKYKDVTKILKKNVDDKYYLSEKIKPTILSSGTGGFYSKSEINQLIARPLTATMVKMHRASQDNYYSDKFINATKKEREKIINKEDNSLINQRIRKITPEEALLLQGFSKEFYKNIKKEGVSDHQILKQAGNAVSVNVVYSILSYLKISKMI